MKKFLPFLIVLFFLGSQLQAQTVDEIINRNIEAKGGIEKIESVQNLVFTDTATNKGNILQVVLIYDHEKAMRSEFILGNSWSSMILKKKEGWRQNSRDTTGATPMKEWEIADGQFQLDVHGVYINYKKKGYEGVYMGKDTALGKLCDKVKLVKKGEGDKIYFFDEDHMLVKSIIKRLTAPGIYVESENYYLDYKKNEQGYLFSYTRKAGNETISFTSITANASLPDIYFKPN